MPFYGVFVTFENLDFRELFCPYWKSDEPNITFDDAKSPSVTPSKIHKVIWGYCYCITCSSLRSFVFFKFFTNLHNILWKRVESWDHPNAFKLFTSIWAGKFLRPFYSASEMTRTDEFWVRKRILEPRYRLMKCSNFKVGQQPLKIIFTGLFLYRV